MIGEVNDKVMALTDVMLKIGPWLRRSFVEKLVAENEMVMAATVPC